MKVQGVIIKFCFVCVLSMLCTLVQAQLTNDLKPITIDVSSLPKDLRFYNPTSNINKTTFVTNEDPMSRLGFVCKWEHKNDKRSKMPLRLRLGTLDYVNKLEGK